jgi:predicted regulator of Ras-like GTPase activity (Roadblock/LC7/MglB family)
MKIVAVPLCLLLMIGVAAADEPALETLLEGLDRPTAVVVQPQSGKVFVAESGAGRIVVVADDKSTRQAIVADKPAASGHARSPLQLVFFDQATLLVADGGFTAGAEKLRLFGIAEKGTPFKYPADARTEVTLATSDDKPLGAIASLAMGKGNLYAAIEAADGGLVARSVVSGTKFSIMQPFTAIEPGRFTAIAVSPRGEVVASRITKGESGPACSLAFFSSSTGRKLMELEAGLTEITALAYDPQTGLLYALNGSALDGSALDGSENSGGLYRLDRALSSEATPGVMATKIVGLERPTAMAFAAEGSLYITLRGGNDAANGRLVRLTPGE